MFPRWNGGEKGHNMTENIFVGWTNHSVFPGRKGRRRRRANCLWDRMSASLKSLTRCFKNTVKYFHQKTKGKVDLIKLNIRLVLYCCTCTASSLPIHTHTLFLLLRCLPSFSITRSSSFSARVLPPNFCGGLSSPIPYRRRKEGWVRQISSAPPNRRRADKRTEERSQVKSQRGIEEEKGVTHTHTLFSSFACKWPTHTHSRQTERTE